MIASLPMYDRPETAAINDKLWKCIAKYLGSPLKGVPNNLTRSPDPWLDWRSGNVLLSQTCSLPFRLELHRHLEIVGAPDHGLEGSRNGYYRSVIVANSDDPRTKLTEFSGDTFAYNSDDSQSGYAALLDHCQTERVSLVPGIKTEAHVASARAVAKGREALAAIDAVTYDMLVESEDFAGDLKVIGWTEKTPALPFVTSFPELVDPLFDAIRAAIADLSGSDRKSLRLEGLVRADRSEYLALRIPSKVGALSSP